jgi:hypothetical protein
MGVSYMMMLANCCAPLPLLQVGRECLVSVRMHLHARETVDEAQWCLVSIQELGERCNLGDCKSPIDHYDFVVLHLS